MFELQAWISNLRSLFVSSNPTHHFSKNKKHLKFIQQNLEELQACFGSTRSSQIVFGCFFFHQLKEFLV